MTAAQQHLRFAVALLTPADTCAIDLPSRLDGAMRQAAPRRLGETATDRLTAASDPM